MTEKPLGRYTGGLDRASRGGGRARLISGAPLFRNSPRPALAAGRDPAVVLCTPKRAESTHRPRSEEKTKSPSGPRGLGAPALSVDFEGGSCGTGCGKSSHACPSGSSALRSCAEESLSESLHDGDLPGPLQAASESSRISLVLGGLTRQLLLKAQGLIKGRGGLLLCFASFSGFLRFFLTDYCCVAVAQAPCTAAALQRCRSRSGSDTFWPLPRNIIPIREAPGLQAPPCQGFVPCRNEPQMRNLDTSDEES